MTKLKVPQLHAGDVILYPANATDFQHSAMVIGGGNLVHADANSGEGFVREEPVADTERYCPRVFEMLPDNDKRWPAEVYRCKNAKLAEAAAEYARRFGRGNALAPGATKYGADRGRGVSVQLKGDPNPPFEFDAIYRAFKWANGGGKGADQFSANQGTTCAAFVVACYQAGAIRNLASGDEGNMSACLEMIRSWRADKKRTKAARWTLKPVPKQAGLLRPDAYKREVSNVGPAEGALKDWTNAKEGDARAIAEDAWGQLGTVLAGEREDLFGPERYMTTAMKVDAQFVFTNTLRTRLHNDGNWTRSILDFE